MNLELANEHQSSRRQLDTFAGEVPIKLTKEELRKLSRLSPLRSFFHIVAEWSLVLGAIYFCQRLRNPILYAGAVAFIGARQHALLILMHDGAHYRLFRNRRLNDWVSEIVLGWPCLISARAYRHNHFGHHRYLNSEQDPDWVRKQGDPTWVFPKRWEDLAGLLLHELSGLGAISLLRVARALMSEDTGLSRAFILARYGFYLAVALAIVWAGVTKLFLMYWMVPYFTWLILIFRVRSIAEHFAIEGRASVYAHARTTRPHLLERIFVAPKNVNYHIEHHFYPSVPFYRLPELHKVLLSKPGFAGSAHITRTYWGVLRECLGRPDLNSDSSLPDESSVLRVEAGSRSA